MAFKFGVGPLEVVILRVFAVGMRLSLEISLRSFFILNSMVTLSLVRLSWRRDQPKKEKFLSVFPKEDEG